MCGIAGLWDISRANDVVVTIDRMVAAMSHRGPDDHGVYHDREEGICIGQSRLAILDLTPLGHQPMSFANLRYWITYNGEVYNYRELRNELELLGERFVSGTDTEVVLAAYAHWGAKALNRLRGMFAFGIWDSLEKTLFLARDRFGIKPLYYVASKQSFAFASEVRALRAGGVASNVADLQAIWDYLSFGSIVQPRTVLRDVRSLPPGNFAVLKRGEFRIERYWDAALATAKLRNELIQIAHDDAVTEVRRLLDEATRYHLLSDVAVGAFLSGGVDSSTVVGLMAGQVSKPVKTYAIGFDQAHTELDELRWAGLVARHFATDHHEIILSGAAVAQGFERFAKSLDQPSMDGTNTFFVSMAARQGVKVALSGLGGDELFAGYPHFSKIVAASAMFPNGSYVGRLMFGRGIGCLPGRWRLPLERMLDTPELRLAKVRLLRNEGAKRGIVNPQLFHEYRKMVPFNQRYGDFELNFPDLVSRISYMEIKGYLSDTLLRDADAMSMAHSLEVRPVLLDHKVAEYVFALPARLKSGVNGGKRLLVDAVADLLPRQVIERPKMGFELPLVPWLRKELRSVAREAFASPAAGLLFAKSHLRQIDRMICGEVKASNELWAWFILARFLGENKLALNVDCEQRQPC